MAGSLREALDDLASDVEVVEPSKDLWKRGKRRHRTRRAAALAAAAAVVAGAVIVVPELAATRAEAPVIDFRESELAIPDRLWQPSGWTPGTDAAGPPGRIAVAFYDNARRRSGDDNQGIMTVSAVDGSYRYLDLPDAPAAEFLLSPNGRYLAATGNSDVDALAGWISSLSVFDAETAEVTTHDFGSDVSVDLEGMGAVWVDDSTLLLDRCRVTDARGDGYSCTGLPPVLWDLRTDTISAAPWSVPTFRVSRWRDGLVLTQQWVQRLDRDTGTATRMLHADRGEKFVVDASGSAFAGTYDATPSVGGDDADGQLVWGRVPESPGDVAMSDVGSLKVAQVHGWASPRSVVVSVLRDGRFEVPAVDVRTGRERPFVEIDPSYAGYQIVFAEDLLSRPTRPGVEPPAYERPRDGWRLLGVAGAVALMALALIVARLRRSR